MQVATLYEREAAQLVHIGLASGRPGRGEVFRWLDARSDGSRLDRRVSVCGGQGTTARLLAASMRILAERPDLQALVRKDRQRIPDFIEETFRPDGPVQCALRLTLRSTQLAGVDIPAGTTIAAMRMEEY